MVVALLGGVAYAENDPVAGIEAAKRAEDLVKAGRHVEGATMFRSAYRLDPRPEYLCNIGVAYHRAKVLPKAQIYLAECLRRGKSMDASFLDLVRKSLDATEATLKSGDFTPLDIVVTPDTASLTVVDVLDRDETLVGSQLLWVPFGKVTIVVTATGLEPQRREVEALTHTTRQVVFELVPPKPVEPTPIATRSEHRSRTPALVATLATAAVGVSALGAYIHARGIMSDAASTEITRSEYGAVVDRAHTWQHASWVMGGVSALGAGVSAWLWLRSGTKTTIEVSTQNQATAFVLSGVW